MDPFAVLARDWTALVLLSGLILALLYLARELRTIRGEVEPLLNSPLVRGLT